MGLSDQQLWNRGQNIFGTFLLLISIPCSLQEPTLRPRQPPIVRSQPNTNVTVVQGEAFILDCHISNRANEDTILWKHGSQVLQADHVRVRVDPNLEIKTDPEGPSYRRSYKTSLRVRQANTNYAGRYLCVIEWNTKSEPVQVEFQVSIIIPPTIEAASSTVEKKEGEGAELACIAGGSPQPNITWTRRGETLRGEDRPIILLRNLSKEDSGTYTCNAENGSGYPKSASIRLSVLYGPRVTGLPPEVVAIRADRTVVLSCRVDALPRASVTWYNQRGMLVADKYPASSNATHHSLRLQRISERELGAFTCIARNELGEDRTTVLLSGRPSAVRVVPSSPTSPESISLQWVTTSFSPVDISTISYRRLGSQDWLSHRFQHPRPAQGASKMENSWSFLIRNLKPSTPYELKVSSRNRHGSSQPSTTVTITTQRSGYSDRSRHTADGEENDRDNTWGHFFSSSSPSASKPLIGSYTVFLLLIKVCLRTLRF